jgi:hypothetical protein
MLRIHYILDDLVEDDASPLIEALNGFPAFIKAWLPTLEVRVETCPEDVAQNILASARSTTDFANLNGAVLEILTAAKVLEPVRRVVVLCGQSSVIPSLARSANSAAKYGAFCGALASVYHLHTNVMWHEMLHLLGTTDCYEKNPEGHCNNTCNESACLMQYDPCSVQTPVLCPQKIRELEKYCAQHC